MGIPDVGDNGHVGLHDAAEILDLPEVIHAHLDHADLVVAVEPQKGEGQPNLIIEISLRLEDLEPLPQYRGHHILGRGLAHAARNGHKGDAELLLVMPGQIPQRLLGTAHFDIELAGQIALPLPLGKAARRPALQGFVQEGVSVKPLPHQGNEQRARIGDYGCR